MRSSFVISHMVLSISACGAYDFDFPRLPSGGSLGHILLPRYFRLVAQTFRDMAGIARGVRVSVVTLAALTPGLGTTSPARLLIQAGGYRVGRTAHAVGKLFYRGGKCKTTCTCVPRGLWIAMVAAVMGGRIA